MHFSNHLDTAEWPSPSPSKQCWDEETLLRQVQCSGVHKLQRCLGERGKGGKIKVDRVNCPKNFVLHF